MNQIRRKTEKAENFLENMLRKNIVGSENQRLTEELIALSQEKKTAVRRYYEKKTRILGCIFLTGCIFTLIAFLVYTGQKEETVTSIHRPGYGQGDRVEELEVFIEGEQEAQQIEITVQEQKYTQQEKQEFLVRAAETLDTVIKGENESLDCVQTDLELPESLEAGRVQASWTTIPYGVIGDDGTLLTTEDEMGTVVELQGTLTCDGQEAFYSVFAKVFPPSLSDKEALYQTVRESVEQADVRESHQESLNLPDQVNGRRLIWNQNRENPVPAALAATVLVLAGLYVQMDNEIHKRAEKRRNQLMLEYPDFMWKMTMLLGAGMSMKGAFSRIASEYAREKNVFVEKHRGRRFPVRYVCEEITYTCYEMESGIPEAAAYERFGKRCQLPEYIRIGTVLSQNLKKGAKGLTALLETEAETSLNERKSHARKIGEQAGTKLLLPMVLMLAVVLAILIIPAFMAF